MQPQLTWQNLKTETDMVLSFLPPCAFQERNLGCQTWQQAPYLLVHLTNTQNNSPVYTPFIKEQLFPRTTMDIKNALLVQQAFRLGFCFSRHSFLFSVLTILKLALQTSLALMSQKGLPDSLSGVLGLKMYITTTCLYRVRFLFQHNDQ